MRRFRSDGYTRLGSLLNQSELAALTEQIDQIMLGTAEVPYDQMLMQLEPSINLPEALRGQSNGHKLSTLAYRKIQDLDLAPLFKAYLTRSLFADLCRQVYGKERSIACMRAMFINKPVGGSSDLVWHQDRWSHLDRDPKITVWTALDPATIDNGCVEIVPGSHRRVLNPSHTAGFLTDNQRHQLTTKLATVNPDFRTVQLELNPGEAVLLHNWTLHRSGTNNTDTPRRAFSVCYMDSATRGISMDSATRGLSEGSWRLVFSGHTRAQQSS